MSDRVVGTGDFVRVATCATPTEAHILKGVLESAGLSAQIADANLGQANPWMTQVLGGVRLLVPESQATAAREAIAEFNAGAFQLEGEEAAVRSFAELPRPAFSPDRAVVLSFLLTPIFGASVQLANSWILGVDRRQVGQLVWLVLLTGASMAAIAVLHRLSPGPLVAFRASFVMSFITVVWYFLAGQQQSRRLLDIYGSRYMKRSLVVPALIATALLLALGWSISEFA